MTDLRDIIDTDDLGPEEEARLQRLHELLLEAGPPAEMPPELDKPVAPDAPGAEIIAFPLLPKRRVGAAVLIAAAAAAAAFVGGFVFGHAKAKPAQLAAAHIVTMHSVKTTGVPALAVLKVGKSDAVGNWPMEVSVSGLPEQPQRSSYYELWLTQKGKPTLPCGIFRVHGKTTTIRLTVPYSLKHASGWIVTRQGPGAAEPGATVLTT